MKAEIVPEYIDRVVEKIIMLPQIVEVEKKCYMIEEINGFIAKNVDLEIHTERGKCCPGSILGLTSEKLYLMVSDQTPKDIPNAFYFKVDDLIVQTCRIWSTSPT